ncbi:MAG: type IV toxin-antitoxin system AbiEi family antitoxin domain-containing protein, partial [Actinomycetota bacterium]
FQLADRQGGVVTRNQALQIGLSDGQIDGRVARGDWMVVSQGGYRIFDLPGPLNLARAAAAVLPGAVVSHFSAAHVLDIPRVDRDTASVTVHSKTTHSFPGVRVFRTRDLDPSHSETHDGLQVTTLERTVIDLGAVLSERHLSVIVDNLIADDRCSVIETRNLLESLARRGKPGIAKLRRILDERADLPHNGTPLERAGIQLLIDAGFTDFVQECPIPWAPHRRFDIAFPSERLAVEWDSKRWHTLKAAFQQDRERDREVVEHDWRILRFTWEDVHNNPSSVITSISSVLAT